MLTDYDWKEKSFNSNRLKNDRVDETSRKIC